MKLHFAQRMSELTPYLFATLNKKYEAACAKGIDVIALTIGDPDMPTPKEIVEAGRAALLDPANYRYPAYSGSQTFRRGAAQWMQKRFGVQFDPDTEILALIGTKDGIAHLPFALVDPGDVVLCPEPCYPVYATGTRLAGGKVHYLPLTQEHDFLPQLDAIPPDVARRAKMLWINYPNNPTSAVCERDFLARAVSFCNEYNIVLCADCAYSEITFDKYRTSSVFEIPRSRDVAVEFHTLSKTYNMTGWRVGFVVGRPDVVEALGRLKSNLDSGVFSAVQHAAVTALQLWPAHLQELTETYYKRRNILLSGLRACGYEVLTPKATFYVWCPVPGKNDQEFANRLIEEAGVLVTPGSNFGPSGKGYVRFALTVSETRMQQAVERIQRVGIGS